MNSIELKTLGELSKYSFYIPAYQRGYRWTEQEVKDLLNDIIIDGINGHVGQFSETLVELCKGLNNTETHNTDIFNLKLISEVKNLFGLRNIM